MIIVSDITRAKYETIIQRDEGKNIWIYVCRRKDKRVALVIPYHHESGVLAPPMMHRECKVLDQADSDCICQFLGTLCNADPWAFINWGDFKRTHNHQVEPPPLFWDLMMAAIEARRVPEESAHETL